MRMLRFLAMLLLSSACTQADAWPTAAAALDRFLRFELAGGRLLSWPTERYILEEAPYGEPGWDTVSVVRGYRVLGMKCAPHRCIASVQFTFEAVPKVIADNVEAHVAGSTETLTYVALESNGQWFLGSRLTEHHPMVTVAAMRAQLTP